MGPSVEKRLLQIALVAAAAFSLFFGTLSVIRGVAVLLPSDVANVANLDSHFRYLSGIFLGVVVALVSCAPGIEHKSARFRLLGGLVVCGGLARLLGVLANGAPGTGHLIGLALELVATPALLVWQTRLARRFTPKPG